jgi:hypothetical protein
MNTLVSEIAAAIVPKPVPIVVKAILCVVVLGGRAEPWIVVHTGRHGFRRRPPDCVAPLEAQASRMIHVADQSVVHFLNRVSYGHAGAAVRSVLDNLAVLLRSGHNLFDSKTLCEHGFSQYTCLPACRDQIVWSVWL